MTTLPTAVEGSGGGGGRGGSRQGGGRGIKGVLPTRGIRFTGRGRGANVGFRATNSRKVAKTVRKVPAGQRAVMANQIARKQAKKVAKKVTRRRG